MPSRGLIGDSWYAVRSALAQLRALPLATLAKLGLCAAAMALFGFVLALRGEEKLGNRSPAPGASHPRFAAMADVARPTHAVAGSRLAAKANESKVDFKADAQSYATAARKGDARGLNKLVTMTRAEKCEARSEAADALATLRSPKATAALVKLSRASFKDESSSPGLFSCSSRRAAQKALEKKGHG